MNYKKIIIIIVIVSLIVIAFLSMDGMLTPYVSFQSAISSGKSVQIIGKLSKSDTMEYFEGYYIFSMNDDDGTKLRVIHRGTQPLNFQHADQVVALGSYNSEEKIFEADNILVKCPSKYVEDKK